MEDNTLEILKLEAESINKIVEESQAQLEQVQETVTKLTVVRDALLSQIGAQHLEPDQLELDLGGE